MRRAGLHTSQAWAWKRGKTSAARPLLKISCRSQILRDVAKRLVDRDLLVGPTTRDQSDENLPDFPDHMRAHFDEVLADIRSRDERDANRDVAPLKQASDALLLDTSYLTPEEAIAEAIRMTEERLALA